MAARVVELTALLIRDSSDLFVALDRVGSPYNLMIEYLRKILKCQLEGVAMLAEPHPDMYRFLLILESAVSIDYDFKEFLDEQCQQDGIFWPFFFWVSKTCFKINFIDHAQHRVMCLTTRQFRENRRYYRSDLLDHELATPELVVCVEMWDKLTASMESFRLKHFPDDITIPKELLDRRSAERRSLMRLSASPTPSELDQYLNSEDRAIYECLNDGDDENEEQANYDYEDDSNGENEEKEEVEEDENIVVVDE